MKHNDDDSTRRERARNITSIYGWLRLNDVRVRARLKLRLKLKLKYVPHAALGLQHHRHCAVCATERSHHLGQAANPLSVLSLGAVRQCSAAQVQMRHSRKRIKQAQEGGSQKTVRSENSQEEE